MSYTEFISNYSLDNSQSKKGNDSKPKILDELLKENTSNNSPPKNIPLMSSKDKLKLRKDKHVLGHHPLHKATESTAYAHQMLFISFQCRKESDLSNNPSGSYSEKLLNPDILRRINSS